MIKKAATMMIIRFLLFALTGLFFFGPGVGIGRSEGAFLVGVQTHFAHGKGNVDANLSMIRQSGAKSIRDEIYWRDVESRKGVLELPGYASAMDCALEMGIEPFLILCYGNPLYDGGRKPYSDEAIEAYARYCEFLVRHYKGKIKYYEVWNEWDGTVAHGQPGTPEGYVKLLRAVYPRIKAIDPQAVVIAGALTYDGLGTGWLQKLSELNWFDALDGVSIHPYISQYEGKRREPESLMETLAKVQALLSAKNKGREVPVYITEMGWATQIAAPRGNTQEQSAAYLSRLYLMARTLPSWLKGIWVYDFQDDGVDFKSIEDNYGLVRTDLTPKQSYYTFRSISTLVADSTFVGRMEAGDPEIFVLSFKNANGTDTWALWSTHPDDYWEIWLRAKSPKQGGFSLAQAGRPAVERSWGDRVWLGNPKGAVFDPDLFRFTVQATPWLISGDLSDVSVEKVVRCVFPEKRRAVPRQN